MNTRDVRATLGDASPVEGLACTFQVTRMTSSDGLNSVETVGYARFRRCFFEFGLKESSDVDFGVVVCGSDSVLKLVDDPLSVGIVWPLWKQSKQLAPKKDRAAGSDVFE